MTKPAKKWDPVKKEYKDCQIPIGAYIGAERYDFVECAQCGKKVLYGDCYTSLHIHTVSGFGYAVCGKCYEKEMREEESAMKENEEC